MEEIYLVIGIPQPLTYPDMLECGSPLPKVNSDICSGNGLGSRVLEEGVTLAMGENEEEANICMLEGFCDRRQHKHSWGEHGKMQSNNHGSLSGSKVKLNDGGGTE